MFGVSDGLVSNVSLVLGVAGAHPAASLVKVAGLAGLIGGAFSMAAGEYVSMRAQRELLERELELERREIHNRPENEQRELAHIYASRGIAPELANRLAGEIMRDPKLALDTHAREELGINPASLGAPLRASFSSFGTFAVGALVPLIAWFFMTGHSAVITSVVLGGAGAFAVGIGLSAFTGRSWLWSAIRQVLIAAVAAGITYSIGVAIGVSGVS